MTLADFLEKLGTEPQSISFSDTMAVIEQHYLYTPTAFSNGNQHNDAGSNEGSCKILAFGAMHQLPAEQTLQCFGDYYRNDVMQHPDADDHQNIRQFMQHGWDGVRFENNEALTART